jgi:hypothetical protein
MGAWVGRNPPTHWRIGPTLRVTGNQRPQWRIGPTPSGNTRPRAGRGQPVWPLTN